MEDDAGGDDKPGISEEPGVVNGENPTGLLVRHTDASLVLLVARGTGKAVVRAIRVTAITGLVTLHAPEGALSINTELVFGAGLAEDALIYVHAAVLCVHAVALLALSASLGSW